MQSSLLSGIIVTLSVMGWACAADAQSLRPLCPDRPGLGTPACTLDPGHVLLETGLADWTRQSDPQGRSDTITGGDLLLRLGVTETLEVQAGWTAIGYDRQRDRTTGHVTHDTGTGDITLAVRQNLAHPDGSGLSLAVMPYVTLPTGGSAIGAGDIGAGFILPVSYGVSDTLTLSLTPEIDDAVDQDRSGHHLAYGSVIGLGIDVTPDISTTLELQATRDDDPAGHATQTLAGLSLAWQPKDDLQLDAGSVLGLNHDSPDVELYVGISRRF